MDRSRTTPHGAAAAAPFVGPQVHASGSERELQDAMSALAVSHELTALTGKLDGLVTGFEVGDVHLSFVRYGAPTRVVADGTGDLVCWTIPVQDMDVAIGGDPARSMTLGFVLSRERETAMLPSPRAGAIVITTNEARLSQHYRRVTGRADGSLDVAPGPSDAPAGYIDAAWRHAAGVLGGGAPVPPVLVQSLEEVLLTSLLLELPSRASGVLSDLGDAGAGTPARSHTRRAIAWAEQNLGRPITLQEWASAVGVSVRHLQKSFQQLHCCSPTQFLLLLRLDRAHQRLRHPDDEVTVTKVAAEAGFTHLSRFAAAYRAQYGVSPSHTLRGDGTPMEGNP